MFFYTLHSFQFVQSLDYERFIIAVFFLCRFSYAVGILFQGIYWLSCLANSLSEYFSEFSFGALHLQAKFNCSIITSIVARHSGYETGNSKFENKTENKIEFKNWEFKLKFLFKFPVNPNPPSP